MTTSADGRDLAAWILFVLSRFVSSASGAIAFRVLSFPITPLPERRKPEPKERFAAANLPSERMLLRQEFLRLGLPASLMKRGGEG
jgi:hypothetical protein